MRAKKILIPTDFTVKSLETVKRAIAQTGLQPLDIVLLHGANLPNSTMDLLFFSKARIIKKLKTEEFTEACDILRNKYSSKIRSFHIEVITSNRSAYFKNFIDASKIQEIYVPTKGTLNFRSTKGFNTLSLMKKCDLPHTTIDLGSENEHSQDNGQVLKVFFSGVK